MTSGVVIRDIECFEERCQLPVEVFADAPDRPRRGIFSSKNGVANAVMSPSTTQHQRVHRNAARGGSRGLRLRLMPEHLSAGSVGQVFVAGGRPGDAFDVGRPAQQRTNRRGGDKLGYDFGIVAWM